MKKFKIGLMVSILAIAVIFNFTGQNVAHATLASGFLGVATGYSVFGDAGISEAGTNTPNTLWGDIGINGVALSPTAQGEQVGAFHPTDPSSYVVNATGAAHLALAPTEEAPTGGNVDLSASNISVGPGVYTITGGGVFSKTLTLTGSGTYIFQYDGTIAQETGGTMILGPGATACNVYWYTPYDMTFADGGNFFGTISAGTKITFAAAATLQGRAWAGTYVALHDQTITQPTCTGTLNVIKTIVGGPIVSPADFSVHITDDANDDAEVTGSPHPGEADPGTTYSLAAGTYTVSESETEGGPSLLNYDTSFSGDACDDSDTVTLSAGDDVTCTITNTYKTPTLTLDKIVVGGSSAESAWTLTATGPTAIFGPGAAESTDVVSGIGGVADAEIGTYTLSESGTPANYTASAWSCLTNTGAPVTVTNASVVIAPSANVICTITNTYHAPSSGGGGYRLPAFLPSINIISTPIIPKLPKTGFPPQEKNSMLPVFILSGLSLVSIFLYFAQKKQTT